LWRTEREINEERKKELTQRRAITLNVYPFEYSFKGMKLNRADLEWLHLRWL